MQCLPALYMKNGGTLEGLKTVYGIDVKRHLAYPNLVTLKYNILTSPMASPLARQCRGLILDEDNYWSIVAWPFDKFFNHGEEFAAEIDWNTANVYEKYDGSLAILYFYAGKWRVGTSGTPDASGMVGGHPVTYSQLFWKIWHDRAYTTPTTKYTYMFELVAPINRVVVKQDQERLVFLGARDPLSGSQFFPHFWTNVENWEIAEVFPRRTLHALLETFKQIDPTQQEGYVVVDAKYNRIKIKHPGYIDLHHMRGNGMSPKRVLGCILRNESAEVLAVFPEWKPEFDVMGLALRELEEELESEYHQIRLLESQKDFALRAMRSRCSAALFAVRKGKVQDIREYLGGMHIDTLESTLNLPKRLKERSA